MVTGVTGDSPRLPRRAASCRVVIRNMLRINRGVSYNTTTYAVSPHTPIPNARLRGAAPQVTRPSDAGGNLPARGALRIGFGSDAVAALRARVCDVTRPRRLVGARAGLSPAVHRRVIDGVGDGPFRAGAAIRHRYRGAGVDACATAHRGTVWRAAAATSEIARQRDDGACRQLRPSRPASSTDDEIDVTNNTQPERGLAHMTRRRKLDAQKERRGITRANRGGGGVRLR